MDGDLAYTLAPEFHPELEEVVGVYPVHSLASTKWQLPSSKDGGWLSLTDSCALRGLTSREHSLQRALTKTWNSAV